MDRTPSLSEIERLEGLRAKATQEPWMRSGVRQKLGDEDCLRIGPDGFALAFLPIGARPHEQAGAIADADYIVALHNAFPDLAQALRESMEREALRIVFDGPPGPDGPRLIEAENAAGQSVNAGEWRERPDGYWELVIAGGWRPIAEHDGSDAPVDLWQCGKRALLSELNGGQSCP